MSLIVVISALIRMVAMVWSVVTLRRLRDWRMVLLTIMLLLMAANQIAALVNAEPQPGSPLSLHVSLTELGDLIISIMALLAVVLLPRTLAAHQETAQTLGEREARIRAIVNTAVEAIITIDDKGIVESLNPAAVRMFGYTADEVLGSNVNMLMPEPYRDEHDGYVSAYLRTGQAKVIGIGREIVGRRMDGTLFPIELAVSEFRVGGQRRFAGVVRDITDRKQAEDERLEYQKRLRSLTSELSMAEQRQRRQLATDLHDHIGQTLAIAKIKLGQVRQIGGDTPLVQPIDEVRELIDQAITSTRTLTFELGLEAAIESLGDDVREKHGLAATFQDDAQPKPLGDDLRAVLFQSVRELLNNVVKHAQASKVRLSIHRNGQSLQVTVEDDGRGFSVPDGGFSVSKDGGFGLFNISERLGHLGGQMQVHSTLGQGTRIALAAPLAAASPDQEGAGS